MLYTMTEYKHAQIPEDKVVTNRQPEACETLSERLRDTYDPSTEAPQFSKCSRSNLAPCISHRRGLRSASCAHHAPMMLFSTSLGRNEALPGDFTDTFSSLFTILPSRTDWLYCAMSCSTMRTFRNWILRFP